MVLKRLKTPLRNIKMAPNVASSSELSIYSLLPLVSKLQDLLEPTLDTLIKIYAKKGMRIASSLIKVRKSQENCFLSSVPPKKQQTFFPTSALASKKLPNEKCKHFIILN